MGDQLAVCVRPVEYAVAVDRYLADARLSPGSQRVYRISLQSWAWPLVEHAWPTGMSRRKAVPPVVPLAVLDQHDAGRRLAVAISARLNDAGVRTVNRELSALRSAICWWRQQEWISTDPTTSLMSGRTRPAATPALTTAELNALFRTPASLREQTLWHLLRDSGVAAETVLGLDASSLDLRARRAVARDGASVRWGARTAELLSWLLAGRRDGPVFLTDRRAPAGAPATDLYPLNGRGRMSYRRAAEIFTEHTRVLDPAGRGWTLHQLRHSRPMDYAS